LRTQKKSVSLEIDGKYYEFDIDSKKNKIVNGHSIRILVKSMNQTLLDDYLDQLVDELDVDLLEEKIIPDIYQILKWNEINEMIIRGLVDIGSHTHSHYNLKNCDEELINKELLLSKNIIEKKTKRDCLYFSYPHGRNRAFSELTKELLIKSGFKCAMITEPGMNDETSDIFELKRYSVTNNDSFHEFIFTLSGAREIFAVLKHNPLINWLIEE